MEDRLSVKSNDSLATSEEFDFVGDNPGVSKTPTLDFKNGDLNELTNALTEVLQEPENSISELMKNTGIKLGQSTSCGSPVELGKDPLSMENNLVEQKSILEQQDLVKPDISSEEECCSK